MELRFRNEISVGLLVLVGVVAFFFGFRWLRAQSGRGGSVSVQAHFRSAGGITSDDPVIMSGVAMGRVTNVDLQGVDSVVVTLSVLPRWRPKTDAWARVSSLTFLGDVALEYSPGTSAVDLPDGAFIEGRQASGLLDQVGPLATKADTLLAGLNAVLESELVQDLQGTLRATQRALTTLTEIGAPTAAQAVKTLVAFEASARRLDSTLASPDLEKAIQGMDDFMVALTETAASFGGIGFALQSVMEKVNQGEGTLGRMVTDTTLHHDMHLLMTAMTKLLDDFRERPGRYFTVKVF